MKRIFIVVGLNSIGRSVSQLIAAAGLGPLVLVDNTTVTTKGLEQGFVKDELGMKKTEAVKYVTFDCLGQETSTHEDLSACFDAVTANVGAEAIAIFCEPLSDKGKIHSITALRGITSNVYFAGFYDDGEGAVILCTKGTLSKEEVAAIPEGPERPEQGGLLAARLFSSLVSQVFAMPSPTILA